MNGPQPRSPMSGRRNWFKVIPPWLILGFGMAATALAWAQYRARIEDQLWAAFARDADDATQEVNNLLRSYESVLWSAKAHVDLTGVPKLRDWERYVRALDLSLRFPGLRGIGFIDYVPASQVPVYQKKFATQASPGSEVHPAPNPGADLLVIRLIEPLENNRPAVGYDVGSETIRRQAAELARDEGELRSTAKVTLVQDVTRKEAGFLIYVPVYKSGVPPADLEGKRREILGWVYSPFLLSAMLQHVPGLGTNLSLIVYDGDGKDPSSILFRSAEGVAQGFTGERRIRFGGREWTLRWSAGPRSHPLTMRFEESILLLLGATITLLLFWIARNQVNFHRYAQEQIDLKTRDLEAAEARLKLILDSTAEAIYGIDSQGLCIFANSACVQMLRVQSEADLIGRNMHAEFHHHHADGSLYAVEQCPIYRSFRENVRIHERCDTFFRSDGTSFPIEYWAYPIRRQEEVVGTVVTFWNVSERLEAEARLRDQQAKILASSRFSALGEMSSGVAHEVNNPLAIINTSAQILHSKALSGQVSAEEVIRFSQRIEDTVRRITRIVSALRSFAREGSQDPFELVSVLQLVKDSLKLYGERIRSHGIHLRVANIDSSLDIECRVVEIQQLLVNLLSNALDVAKEMPDGWIAIDVTELTTGLGAEGSVIEIRITDSGRGIPPEIADRIMEPFFTTKEVGKGTGLGLSVSRGIVEQHGGVLRAETLNGHTSFVVRLPRRRHP